MKYSVTVRRIVREDTVVEVEANNESEARQKAEMDATDVPQEKWDAYDVEYWLDTDAAQVIEGEKENGQ